MRLALCVFAVSMAPAQILTITPAVITECTNGLGHAVLSWNNPLNAPVQVRVLSRDGTPMTGWEPPNASDPTGDWVRDGMQFFLVNQAGLVIDQVTARVNCGGTPDTSTAAFTSAQVYFPMQVGNRWVYRTDSRIVTSGWTVWTLTRTELISGQTWFILETSAGDPSSAIETAYRSGGNGQVYRMPGYPNDTHEELWLDPDGGPLSAAVLKTQQRGGLVSTPLGKLPGLQYQMSGTLAIETGTFVEGLGLLNSSSDMITGSSGGFLSSLNLVEARIGQAVYYATPSSGVSLSAESSTFDVTNKQVTNCAVPCYFTACGFAPGADPPGTYKPCFQARIRAAFASLTAPAALLADLKLADSTGAPVYQRTLSLSAISPAGDAALYTQVPLYASPNNPLAPGAYRLTVTLQQADGSDSGSSSLPVKVQ